MSKRKAEAHPIPNSKAKDPRPRIDILALGGGRYVSAAAKSAILRELKDLGYLREDQACSSSRIRDLRRDVADRRTRFGKLLIDRNFQTTSGVEAFPVQNPLAMLYVAMSESRRFASYVRAARQNVGDPSIDAPWTIVLYIDDVTCGNPLAVREDARRKICGVTGLYTS
jgi:hypothetical protein